MGHMKSLFALAGLITVLAVSGVASAQTAYPNLTIRNPAYVKPLEPLKILGNLYYVGTYDLAVYLLTTPTGHILEDDADLLETGGGRDFRFPQGRGTIYEPVKVDERLKDGGKVSLGGVELTAHHHPGHTQGATSFTYTTTEAGRTYNVLIVNMPSINPGVQVAFMPGWPEIMKAYKTTVDKQKQLKPDVWVSSHAGHFNLHQKWKSGDPYDPN